MNPLKALVETALLGTQRTPLPSAPLPSAPLSDLETQNSSLDRLLTQLTTENHEEELLSAAALVGLYTSAGQLPVRLRDWPQPKAAPSQPQDAERPICNLEASRCLTMMLDSQFTEMLPEFLRALSQANLSASEELLPALLDRGIRATSQRPLIEQAIGQTGQWLAHQNPAWAYATVEAKEWDGLSKLWRKEGSVTSRQALLRQARELDPQLGRQLLESSWKSEQPHNRTGFIRVLEIGLSMADEPFLEAALDDRNRTVRRKAAELLSRLTASRLCKRMAANSETLLTWLHDEKQKAPMIGVSFPKEITPQMVRDGVLLRKTKGNSRARSSQLVELIHAVPLDVWCQRWQKSPEEIVAAAQKSRWPRTIISGFAQAALRQRNLQWAAILLRADRYTLSTINLIPLLSEEKFLIHLTEIAATTNAQEPLDKNSTLVRVLRKWTQPWSEAISRIWLHHQLRHLQLVLQLVEERTANQPAPEKSTKEATTGRAEEVITKGFSSADSLLRTLIKQFAVYASPSLIDEIIDNLLPYANINGAWNKSIHQSVAILRFRRRMLKAVDASMTKAIKSASDANAIGRENE